MYNHIYLLWVADFLSNHFKLWTNYPLNTRPTVFNATLKFPSSASSG